MAKKPISHIDPIAIAFEIIDSFVQIYLLKIVVPFLNQHEKFYSKLNTVLRDIIDKSKPPEWFTANFITYGRTVLVFPCLLFLAWGKLFEASLIVILVDFGDFLDGVVARYWVDERKKKPAQDIPKGFPVPSWLVEQRNKTYGGFVDAVCDKAFVVPCWIYLLSTVSGTMMENLQYFILLYLILAEVSSGCIRFRAYFTSLAIPTPKTVGIEFSSSAVKADHVGKAKQTFEMVGTALYIIPAMRLFGIFFLILAIPLAYESVRRKIQTRVIFIHYNSNEKFNHILLKFWMQAKALGNKLYVGVDGDDSTPEFLNASAVSCVDAVIPDCPDKIDVIFLEKYGIDYCVCTAGRTTGIAESILLAKQCLAIAEDDVVRVVESKGSHQN